MGNDLLLLRVEHVVSAGRRAVFLKYVAFVDKERTKPKAVCVFLCFNKLSVDNMTDVLLIMKEREGKKILQETRNSWATNWTECLVFGLDYLAIRLSAFDLDSVKYTATCLPVSA